jgi:hypothetical protein
MERKGYSGSFGGVVRKIFRKIYILLIFLIDRK